MGKRGHSWIGQRNRTGEAPPTGERAPEPVSPLFVKFFCAPQLAGSSRIAALRSWSPRRVIAVASLRGGWSFRRHAPAPAAAAVRRTGSSVPQKLQRAKPLLQPRCDPARASQSGTDCYTSSASLEIKSFYIVFCSCLVHAPLLWSLPGGAVKDHATKGGRRSRSVRMNRKRDRALRYRSGKRWRDGDALRRTCAGSDILCLTLPRQSADA